MFASIRKTKIYFDIAGMQLVPSLRGLQTRPVIFLIHGGPGSNHLRYKTHSLELQDQAQLIFIDQRGCGRSQTGNASEYTLENNIEDIEALRQYLGLEKIILLGTSYGGVVAQGYAIRYQKNLDKLILVATAPSFRFLTEAQNNLNKNGTEEQIRLGQKLWSGTFKTSGEVERFFKIMDPLYSVKARISCQRNYRSSDKLSWSYQALNKGFSGFLRTFDFIPYLKKIKKPTLILAGKEDWICTPEQSKIMAKNIPNSKVKIFKNCSHAISYDVHDQYIKVIKNFIKSS